VAPDFVGSDFFRGSDSGSEGHCILIPAPAVELMISSLYISS